jgi:hypothetical protein
VNVAPSKLSDVSDGAIALIENPEMVGRELMLYGSGLRVPDLRRCAPRRRLDPLHTSKAVDGARRQMQHPTLLGGASAHPADAHLPSRRDILAAHTLQRLAGRTICVLMAPEQVLAGTPSGKPRE